MTANLNRRLNADTTLETILITVKNYYLSREWKVVIIELLIKLYQAKGWKVFKRSQEEVTFEYKKNTVTYIPDMYIKIRGEKKVFGSIESSMDLATLRETHNEVVRECEDQFNTQWESRRAA